MDLIRSRRRNRRQPFSNGKTRSTANGIENSVKNRGRNGAEESILYPFGKHQVVANSRVPNRATNKDDRVPSREKNKGGVFSVSSGSGPPPRDGNKGGVFSMSSGSAPPPRNGNKGSITSVSLGSGPPTQFTTSNRGSASSSVSTNLSSASDVRLHSPPGTPGSGSLRSKMEQARLTDKNVMLTEEMRRARSATEAHRRFLQRSAKVIKEKAQELKKLQQTSKTEVSLLESRIEELEVSLQAAEAEKKLSAAKHAQELKNVQSHLLSQLDRVRMECSQQMQRVQEEARRKAEAQIAKIRAATQSDAVQAEMANSRANEKKLRQDIMQLRRQLNAALARCNKPSPAPSPTVREDKPDDNVHALEMESLRNELTLQQNLVQQLKEQLKEQSDGAPDREEEHRAALDEFKEIMEEEMESMRTTFEAQLAAEKKKFDDLSRRFNAL